MIKEKGILSRFAIEPSNITLDFSLKVSLTTNINILK